MSLRLNFGCGGGLLKGFENHDADLDITKTPFNYASNSAEVCFASHLLEHVSCGDALRFLMECHRILQLGGIMRLSVPIIGEWLPKELAIDLCVNHGHMVVYNEYSLRAMLWMAGFDQQQIRRVDRHPEWDHHHREIGEARDSLESCRLIATK